jgi:hypothetical protein
MKTSLPTILLICLSVLMMGKTMANETQDSMQNRLLAAAAQNQPEVVQQLLAAGVDIETRDTQGRTALLLATHHNAVEAARFLIESGADVNAMDSISDSPYLYAGAEGRLEILRMTLDHGADLASVNRYGGTALIPAAHHGHVETVRELLQTATDIDHVNNLGWTALLEAVILGDGGPVYIEIVKLLIEAGADAEIADDDGVTPLEHAKQSGYAEITELLSSQ